jgi:hypothetical protein
MRSSGNRLSGLAVPPAYRQMACLTLVSVAVMLCNRALAKTAE